MDMEILICPNCGASVRLDVDQDFLICYVCLYTDRQGGIKNE